MITIPARVEDLEATIQPAQTTISTYRSSFDGERTRVGTRITPHQVANRVITDLYNPSHESQLEPEPVDHQPSDEHTTDDPTTMIHDRRTGPGVLWQN
jgi:hypothetical protein